MESVILFNFSEAGFLQQSEHTEGPRFVALQF